MMGRVLRFLTLCLGRTIMTLWPMWVFTMSGAATSALVMDCTLQTWRSAATNSVSVVRRAGMRSAPDEHVRKFSNRIDTERSIV